MDVVTYPVEEGDIPAGDYILKSLPEGIPKPAPFIESSHAILTTVMEGIRQHFGVIAPHVVTEWEEWMKECPKTDDVEEYIKEFPLHVPLRNTLFAPSGTASHNTTPSNINDINNATYRTQPVVRMGAKRKASNVPILRTDNDRDETRVPDSKYTMHVIFYIILTLCYQQLRIKKEKLARKVMLLKRKC